MTRRTLGTFLWALSGWTAGSMLTFFAGFPAGMDMALGTLVGALVWFDPLHLLWPVAPAGRVRNAGELIAEPRQQSGDLLTQ